MAKRGLFSFLRKKPDGEGDASGGPLRKDGRLRSDLWLDSPGAAERIEAKRAAGELSDDDAKALRHWAERGYAELSVDEPAAGWGEVDEAVERLWREKPATQAMAYESPLKRFPLADEATDRKPGHRISNLHSASEAAGELYLHPAIHGLVGKIFGETPVALQSIYFQWGSGQALHRDPMHVYTSPPSHLIGAWIALEDIGADCGPLTYVAGSHELPYYQFSPGEYRVQHGTHGPEEIRAAEEFDLDQCRRAGLEPEALHLPARRRAPLARLPPPRRRPAREPGADPQEPGGPLHHEGELPAGAADGAGDGESRRGRKPRPRHRRGAGARRAVRLRESAERLTTTPARAGGCFPH